MKKKLIMVVSIILVAAGIICLRQAARYSGKAYRLAQDLKSAGLPVETVKINESDAMYDEVSATGDKLNIKISHYGNGLFMENIVKNLEAENSGRGKVSGPPIYTAGLFIVVVYKEPAAGDVKYFLQNKFGNIREY